MRESVNAMLAGDIDLPFDRISASMPHIRSGRMHALAVTSPQRSALSPEVATVTTRTELSSATASWRSACVARLRAPCAGS